MTSPRGQEETGMPSTHDTFLGHPRGLYVLFFTEMWERFSYYGMRALLIYYMIKHLLFSHAQASQVYGLYTGLVYFTPFFASHGAGSPPGIAMLLNS